MLQVKTPIKEFKTEFLKDTLKIVLDFSEEMNQGSNGGDISQRLNQERKLYLELHEKYKRELVERRKLQNKVEELKGNVRVYLRVRPVLPGEFPRVSIYGKEVDFLSQNDPFSIQVLHEGNKRKTSFEFDRVFNEYDKQDSVFEDISTLVGSFVDGFNLCIMAYGQVKLKEGMRC